MLFGFLLHTLSFAILQFGAIWLSIQKLNLAQVVTQISTNEMLFSFAIILFFVFAMLKFVKKINLIKYFFYIILLVGIKSTFITFFPNFIASTLALLILILYISRKTLLLHNVILGLAILGIGTNLGIMLKPITVILLMSIFSIYDIIAVYKSNYMLKLFKNFAHSGATLAFVYPKTPGKITSNNLFILGTGDVAFPMLLISALTTISIKLSILAAIGSIVGAMTVFYLLSIQKNKRAMPALPPIAICTIAPVVVKLMFAL